MKAIRIVFLAICSTIFTVAAFAQDEKPIRVETNLVNVNVSITDKKGKFVERLTKENFDVFDNGQNQKIEYFSAQEAPVSFGFVYDMHPTTEARTKAVLESLREFTKSLREEDDFFTLVFNNRGSLNVDFVPTAAQLRTHLSGRHREPNALYDAIFLATNKIREKRNFKRVIMVITDSADHNSEHRFNDILKQLKTLDAQIYTVLWDEAEEWQYADLTRDGDPRRRVSSDASSLDRAALEELAVRTGGLMQSPVVQNAGELFRIYNQIAFETRKQYTIGFYPDQLDGKWHHLRIKLRSVKDGKRMALTYRQGYQSPNKAP
ncbi:MAG: VWA domain-containing protein [Pyrinomonadaceae bacterium]|nr:VWA domain-containing protein [Pyrinomonadaceae bacterium]